MSLTSKLAKGSAILLVGIILSKALTYIYRMIVAHFLGPEAYGQVSIGLAVYTVFLTFALIGIPSGVTRYVSYYLGKDDARSIKGVITAAFKLTLPLGLILTAALYFLAGFLAQNLFHDALLKPILEIFSLALVFGVALQILLKIFLGFQRVDFETYLDRIFQSVVLIVITVVLLWQGFGTTGAVWGYVGSIIITTVLAGIILEKNVWPIITTQVKSRCLLLELANFSWPLVFSSWLWMLVMYTDTLMIGYFKGSFQAGIYNAAAPTATFLIVSLTAISWIFLPMITEAYAKSQMNTIKALHTTARTWILMFNMPILCAFIFFPSQVLTLFFGAEYIAGKYALTFIAFGFFIYAFLGRINEMVLTMAKRTKLILVVISAMTLCNVILNALLIPSFNIEGAAISSAIAFFFGSIIFYFGARKDIGCQILTFSQFRIILAGIISGILSYLLFKGYALHIFFIAAIYFVFYFGLLLLFKCLTVEDKLLIKHTLNKLKLKR